MKSLESKKKKFIILVGKYDWAIHENLFTQIYGISTISLTWEN